MDHMLTDDHHGPALLREQPGQLERPTLGRGTVRHFVIMEHPVPPQNASHRGKVLNPFVREIQNDAVVDVGSREELLQTDGPGVDPGP